MASTWTPAQLEALSAKQGNFLISAGAGSGKTSVLTQRIYELVASGETTLSNLLVLTFTNKAAQSMKDKVRKLIKKDPKTSSLAPEVESASIMTFDAFSLALVKKYHYALGLPQDIDVVDASIFTVEKKKLLDEIMDRYYSDYLAGKQPLFGDLVYHYAIKDDQELKDFIIAIDNLGDLQADKAGFFAHYLEEHYDSNFIDRAIDDFEAMIRDGLNGIEAQGKRGYSEAELADADEAFLEDLLACPNYDALYAKMVDLPFVRKKNGVGDDADKALHGKLNKIYTGLRANLVVGDSATIKNRYALTRPYVGLILQILNELDEGLQSFKRYYRSFDFADIASLARQAAKIPEINAELKARYRYIMIDEYQDTSDLQEAFISTIAQDNVFAVGDIKQSIYRFRNANPTLFLKRYQAYEKEQGGHLITLAENFRSRSSVLNDINSIFAVLMTSHLGGVDYGHGQALIYGNHSYDLSEAAVNHRLEIDEYDPLDGIDQAQQEAELIAQDILAKIASNYPVLGDKGLAPCSFSDFAVLIAKKRDFAVYKKVFIDHKIPLLTTDLGETSSEDVVVVLKNLSRLTDLLVKNPASPSITHLYASLARSFLFQMNDEEIFNAIKGKTYAQTPFFKDLQSHKDFLEKANLEDVLNFYINEFDILGKLPSLGEVKANYERIESFLALGKAMGRFGWGLSELVSYFSDLDKYDVEMSIETSDTEPSSVALMSIHASKGLEFPIVYYPGLTGKFNLRDTAGNFLASEPYGIVLPLNDNLEAKNVLHFLSKNYETSEAVSEQLRLFYVALTRAREKMILIRPYQAEPKIPLTGTLARSFNDFLNLANLPPATFHKVAPAIVTLEGPSAMGSDFTLEFRQIHEPAIQKLVSRASKTSLTPPDESSLRYGEKLHRYLELSDLVHKDVSWIADPSDRDVIAKVLALPFFKDVSRAKIFHEYAFYDEEKDLHGIIDLLLVYPDHIDLLDFKARDISDPAYLQQLAAYAAYLAKVFPLPIYSYLLSIRAAQIKGVN